MKEIIRKKIEETAALKELLEIIGKEEITKYSEDGRPIAGRYPLPSHESPIDSIVQSPSAVTVFWKNGGNMTYRARADAKFNLETALIEIIRTRYQYNVGWLIRR